MEVVHVLSVHIMESNCRMLIMCGVVHHFSATRFHAQFMLRVISPISYNNHLQVSLSAVPSIKDVGIYCFLHFLERVSYSAVPSLATQGS